MTDILPLTMNSKNVIVLLHLKSRCLSQFHVIMKTDNTCELVQ
jgi:hypothetical protein